MTVKQITRLDKINERLLNLSPDERQFIASSSSFGLVSKVAIEDSRPKEKEPAQKR